MNNNALNILDISYEKAIQRIQEINTLLEQENTPLEDLCNLYEEACQLLDYCQEKLSNIEQKIYVVTKNGLEKYNNSNSDIAD